MSPKIKQLVRKKGWEQKIKTIVPNKEFETALIKFKGNFKSFDNSWKEKKGTDSKEVFEIILKNYQQPKRAYHNITHISYMLDGIEAAKNICKDLTAVKIAIWFHDAIYDPKKTDNEEKSADLAYDLGIRKGMKKRDARKIKKIILATKHNKVPKTKDQKIIADLDLAVLGLDLKTFKTYSKAMKKEYEFVGEIQYWKNRKIIFERFLKQKKLFYTKYFKEKYETQAIKNINWGIKNADKQLKKLQQC